MKTDFQKYLEIDTKKKRIGIKIVPVWSIRLVLLRRKKTQLIFHWINKNRFVFNKRERHNVPHNYLLPGFKNVSVMRVLNPVCSHVSSLNSEVTCDLCCKAFSKGETGLDVVVMAFLCSFLISSGHTALPFCAHVPFFFRLCALGRCQCGGHPVPLSSPLASRSFIWPGLYGDCCWGPCQGVIQVFNRCLWRNE